MDDCPNGGAGNGVPQPVGPLAAGSIDRRHADVFAYIVLATASEVASMIARADEPAAALSAGESALAGLMDRLLRAPG